MIPLKETEIANGFFVPVIDRAGAGRFPPAARRVPGLGSSDFAVGEAGSGSGGGSASASAGDGARVPSVGTDRGFGLDFAWSSIGLSPVDNEAFAHRTHNGFHGGLN